MSHSGKQSYLGFVLVLMLAVCICTCSCVSVKKYVYFKDLPDTLNKTVVIEQVTPYVDPKIESSDILSITVQPMLQGVSPIQGGGGNSMGSGGGNNGAYNASLFPVDRNGNIEYPLLGLVKVAGLSTMEARDLLRKESLVYYKDPVVNIKITNFNIQILGDVNKPGMFTSPGEKVSIIDAITNAGDLQLSAKRDNILLIRSEGDHKICARYDMSSSKIFQSPYYYLKQNDIIYVEPNKFKVQSSDQSFIRNLGILSSIISIASLILVYKSIR